MPRHRDLQGLALTVGLGALAVLWLLPVMWVVVTSLKHTSDIIRVPPEWIPWPATLEHYVEVLFSSSRTARIGRDAQKTSPEFFTILNFLLQFAPTHPSETALLQRFAAAGIGPGQSFEAAALSADQRQAFEQGMSDAWAAFAKYKREQIDTGKRSSADGFGTRAFLHNDYMARMASAALGIYGNSQEEANYPVYFVDSQRQPLDGTTNRYTVRFGPGQLPPVNAFWSLTMYELPASLLTENAINRYLINAPMEPTLIRDADGGITLRVQHESPGKDAEPNWLPAPKGPFFMGLREYWPKPEALNGSWKVPPAVRATEMVRAERLVKSPEVIR